jgi:hypothetical protein
MDSSDRFRPLIVGQEVFESHHTHTPHAHTSNSRTRGGKHRRKRKGEKTKETDQHREFLCAACNGASQVVGYNSLITKKKKRCGLQLSWCFPGAAALGAPVISARSRSLSCLMGNSRARGGAGTPVSSESPWLPAPAPARAPRRPPRIPRARELGREAMQAAAINDDRAVGTRNGHK